MQLACCGGRSTENLINLFIIGKCLTHSRLLFLEFLISCTNLIKSPLSNFQTFKLLKKIYQSIQMIITLSIVLWPSFRMDNTFYFYIYLFLFSNKSAMCSCTNILVFIITIITQQIIMWLTTFLFEYILQNKNKLHTVNNP